MAPKVCGLDSSELKNPGNFMERAEEDAGRAEGANAIPEPASASTAAAVDKRLFLIIILSDVRGNRFDERTSERYRL